MSPQVPTLYKIDDEATNYDSEICVLAFVQIEYKSLKHMRLKKSKLKFYLKKKEESSARRLCVPIDYNNK